MVIALPENEADLAEAIRGADGPLWVRGGGTRHIGGEEGVSTANLTGITLYEPGALTIVARAGTPLADIEAALQAENQRLPFEPMDHRPVLGTSGTPTIGGVVAANVSGPRRIQAGACRDCLIGVRFVDGTGTVLKNGGRVMKNVTGYDLVKLMAGSHGTLGVLSEVSFKVLPGTAHMATVEIAGLDVAGAVAAMSAALGSPFEVSGAAHITGDARTLLRVEGFDASVAYRAGRLRDLLAEHGDITIERDPAKVSADWAAIRDAAAFGGREGDVWRLSVKPSDAVAVRQSLGDVPMILDWGGGLIWALVPSGTDLRAGLSDIGGHATLVRAAPDTHDALGTFHPEPAPLAAISKGLRERFDPRGILNPGRMG